MSLSQVQHAYQIQSCRSRRAAARAVESNLPNPLYHDPLAEVLAGPKAMQTATQIAGGSAPSEASLPDFCDAAHVLVSMFNTPARAVSCAKSVILRLLARRCQSAEKAWVDHTAYTIPRRCAGEDIRSAARTAMPGSFAWCWYGCKTMADEGPQLCQVRMCLWAACCIVDLMADVMACLLH